MPITPQIKLLMSTHILCHIESNFNEFRPRGLKQQPQLDWELVVVFLVSQNIKDNANTHSKGLQNQSNICASYPAEHTLFTFTIYFSKDYKKLLNVLICVFCCMRPRNKNNVKFVAISVSLTFANWLRSRYNLKPLSCAPSITDSSQH